MIYKSYNQHIIRPLVYLTLAVLGCGLDVIYPPENRDLYAQICDNGAVVSEFPLGMAALAQNFPRRNRLISGFSQGVIVVEADLRSGMSPC